MAENGNGSANGSARWQIWVSIGVFLFTVMGALIGFFMQIAALSSDVRSNAEDITEMKRRLTASEAQANAARVELAQQTAALTEVETQFRASDQIRNIMHADDLRIHAMLWQKSFRTPYPIDNAYYPTIAK